MVKNALRAFVLAVLASFAVCGAALAPAQAMVAAHGASGAGK
jgi:hypothetical protein